MDPMTATSAATSAAPAARAGRPSVWALLGRRTGDNSQLAALAEALGWPCEYKRLSYRRSQSVWTPFYGRMGPSLAPLKPEERGKLAPPWPDLVISIGWRSPPVAQWVARQGGSRLVALGRPRAPLGAFDLVVTTPQYRLPEAGNVLRLEAPLTRLSPGVLAEAAERWRDPLAHLPRPWIAVLVGGDALPYRLPDAAAADLGARVDRMARERGGSVLVATGPRTPGRAARALLAQLSTPSHSFLWGDGGDNPYFGYLALADEIVVTTESVSMAHEASLTGKPLHLFDLPMRAGPLFRGIYRLDARLRQGTGRVTRTYLRLIRDGWLCMPRVIADFHAGLIESGRAVRLGEPVRPPARPPDWSNAEHAADAVRRLFEAG